MLSMALDITFTLIRMKSDIVPIRKSYRGPIMGEEGIVGGAGTEE